MNTKQKLKHAELAINKFLADQILLQRCKMGSLHIAGTKDEHFYDDLMLKSHQYRTQCLKLAKDLNVHI